MTNKQDYAPITYACNGATVDFPFSWKILEKESVVVTLIGKGLETILALGEDYNIDFDEVGGNVKTKTTYALGNSIIIARKASTYQDKSFSTSGGFQASEIEKAFDNVSINLQDMDYNIENFKETFSNKINTKIEVYRDDVENQIESNKQEFLGIQSDFEDKVNTKIQQVSDAAEKINELEEAVNTAVNAANTATSKADSASAEANKATEQASLATKKAHEITDIAEKSLANIESKTQEEINKIKQTGFYMQNDKLYYINSNGETKEFKAGGGLELCDIGTALFVDETKGLRRRLNGSILDINANTQAFLTRLLEIKTTNPDYFTNEETWQSEATLNVDGCVYKFVLNYDSTGTNVTSVRLPKYPDYVEVSAGSSITTAPVSGFVQSKVASGIVLLPNANLNPNWDGNYALTSNGKYQHCNLFAQDGSGNVSVRGIGNGSVYYVDAQADLSSLKLKNTKLKLYYYIQVATGSETENNIVNDIELNNPYVLFKSEYSETPLYNISWLKSEGEYYPKSRCIKAYEALVVENNTDIAVGTTVDLPSGTKYTKRGLSVKLSTDESATDFDFRINTTDEKFRLPLKNGMEGVFASRGKGNGLALGLTNGAVLAGLASNSTSGTIISHSAYGANISATEKTDGVVGTFGVSTDPTKSGIVVDTTVPEGWNLYYYVGETVQNSNLIDAGRIGEELGNKTNAKQAASASVPNYEKAYLYQATINTIFTAPCDGILMGCISTGRNTGNSFIDIYNTDGQIINTIPYGYSGSDVNQYAVNIKLLKDYSAKATCSTGGDIYYETTDHTLVAGKLQFIPLKGAN